MKKYQIIINNVDKVTNYVDLYKGIRTIHMNSLFSQKKLKRLAKKVPKKYDKESIKKFEDETGLKLKYYVFYDKYGFFEYTSLGIYPDNNKIITKNDGFRDYKCVDLEYNYLENFDILIIDRVTNIKKNNK